MSASLSDLLSAVSGQLESVIAQETSVDVHFEAGLFRSAELPSVNVYPTATGIIQDLAAFGDLYGGWPMTIRVAVSPADIDSGEQLLWQFMDDEGSLSIIEALDSDRTLGGLADTLMWGEWAGYLDFSPPDEAGRFIGSTLPIVVAKARTS